MVEEVKIAICITTTPNRKQMFAETLTKWMYMLPKGAIIYIYEDAEYEGVVHSKNKCLENSEWADYVFCFDDDCYPIKENWHLPYIESGLNHACYTFNRQLIQVHPHKDLLRNPPIHIPAYAEYVDPNGCMLFFTRKVIDVCGGWDRDFTGFGYEHSSLSDRIYNNGLTPARYIDIPNSKGLFEMADCESSFTYEDRLQIPNNLRLYQQKYYSKEFKPFK